MALGEAWTGQDVAASGRGLGEAETHSVREKEAAEWHTVGVNGKSVTDGTDATD